MSARRRPAGDDRFLWPAPRLARALIGAVLVHETASGERTAGRIVETEAYLARGDRASHSRSGPTARNRSMFLTGGHAYVYRIYGLHHCFNVVSGPEGRGEAVLLRALEPLDGVDVMERRRGGVAPRDLCRGPARLVQAMGIRPGQDGVDLRAGPLRIEFPASAPRLAIARGPRIGLGAGVGPAADLALRFGLRANRWTSRPFPERARVPRVTRDSER